MRALAIVVVGPRRHPGLGVSEVEDQGLVKELVPHRAAEAFTKAVLRRLSRQDEMPGDLFTSDQISMALQVSSAPLSETIIPGLLRRSISAVSSRVTRRPEIEVSRIAASCSSGSLHRRCQDSEAATICKLAMDKIQRPTGLQERIHCSIKLEVGQQMKV
jgi:hypothetical protein